MWSRIRRRPSTAGRSPGRLAPHCGRVRVESRYHAAAGAHAGGDFYDVVDTPFGVRAIIGDVSGRGPDAADFAAEVLENFRELAQNEIGIAGIAFRLDGYISYRSEDLPERFVTAILVQIQENNNGHAELVGCGHPGPLLLTPGRPPATCELISGLPLGLQELDDCWYSSTWVPLTERDALLLYTNGATEARDREGTPYALPARVTELQDPDPATFLTRVETDLLAHVQAPRDDLALLYLHPQKSSAAAPTYRRDRSTSSPD